MSTILSTLRAAVQSFYLFCDSEEGNINSGKIFHEWPGAENASRMVAALRSMAKLSRPCPCEARSRPGTPLMAR